MEDEPLVMQQDNGHSLNYTRRIQILIQICSAERRTMAAYVDALGAFDEVDLRCRHYGDYGHSATRVRGP